MQIDAPPTASLTTSDDVAVPTREREEEPNYEELTRRGSSHRQGEPAFRKRGGECISCVSHTKEHARVCEPYEGTCYAYRR